MSNSQTKIKPSSKRHHSYPVIVQVVGGSWRDSLVLGGLLVDIGRGVVLLLVNLIADGILGGRGTSAEAGIVVLGNRLVGLLGRGAGGALDRVSDVVGGVVDLVHVDGVVRGRFGWFALVEVDIELLLIGRILKSVVC